MIITRSGCSDRLRSPAEIVEDLVAWHWSAPLYPPFTNRSTPHSVALTYDEWLVYHAKLSPRPWGHVS